MPEPEVILDLMAREDLSYEDLSLITRVNVPTTKKWTHPKKAKGYKPIPPDCWDSILNFIESRKKGRSM